MMISGKYCRIVLGSAARGGVEFSWWIVTPRRLFEVKDGRRVYRPENDLSAAPGEPGRLDDLPGKARVPLAANYWDDALRDARGAMGAVSTWAEIPIPQGHAPTTLADVAARARRDLALMAAGGAGGLLGVPEAPKAAPGILRPMTRFDPEAATDAEFAAAVKRGLDDLRDLDEVRPIRPEEMLPRRDEDGHRH
jgi:hypothetical protein